MTLAYAQIHVCTRAKHTYTHAHTRHTTCMLILSFQVPPTKPVVIVISGPSGVGKDALVNQLKEARRDLYFVVTATSRYVFVRLWVLCLCFC